MRILITGGCGFVGINLAELLLARGESVVLFDRRGLPEAAASELQPGSTALTVIDGDVRDKAALEQVMRDYRIERAIHAAVITSGVARESDEPNEIIAVNLCSTVGFLEAARAAGCRRVLYVSSGSAYGHTLDEAGPLHEEVSPSRPETLYGITKYAAEQTVLRLRALWNFDVLCARLGSVFGPWEYGTGVRDRMSPQLQLACLAVSGGAAVLPAREVRRDWVYSRDVASGLVELLLAKHTRHAVYHLSAGCDWSGFFPRWCNELRIAYPQFSWRFAAPSESPNVSYHADHDRAGMDIGRVTRDVGFMPRFGPRESCADFSDWIQTHGAFIASAGQAAAASAQARKRAIRSGAGPRL
jgi:nucleoside-diphosphate-sugar epimerase